MKLTIERLRELSKIYKNLALFFYFAYETQDVGANQVKLEDMNEKNFLEISLNKHLNDNYVEYTITGALLYGDNKLVDVYDGLAYDGISDLIGYIHQVLPEIKIGVTLNKKEDEDE